MKQWQSVLMAVVAFALLLGCGTQETTPVAPQPAPAPAPAPAATTAPAGVTLALGSATAAPGSAVVVTFSMALPAANDKHWITICPAGAKDDEWGKWEYVDAGKTTVTLKAPEAAGNYEVRLHDQYSVKSYHVVARTPLTVK